MLPLLHTDAVIADDCDVDMVDVCDVGGGTRGGGAAGRLDRLRDRRDVVPRPSHESTDVPLSVRLYTPGTGCFCVSDVTGLVLESMAAVARLSSLILRSSSAFVVALYLVPLALLLARALSTSAFLLTSDVLLTRAALVRALCCVVVTIVDSLTITFSVDNRPLSITDFLFSITFEVENLFRAPTVRFSTLRCAASDLLPTGVEAPDTAVFALATSLQAVNLLTFLSNGKLGFDEVLFVDLTLLLAVWWWCCPLLLLCAAVSKR